MVQMVGLGGGDQHLVDSPADQRRQQAVGAGAETGKHITERTLQILHGFRPAIDGLQRVDQDDLPVEAGKMLAEEGFDNDRLISVVAPFHHGAQRALGRFLVGEARKRREGQCGRPFQIAGHQETAGRQG
ncbi:hypothetical protein D3C86_1388230 [compost metagenome]